MAAKSLLVFAHADEAEAFAAADVQHLITGVGKVNAALSLTEAIISAGGAKQLERIVVLGTAGMIGADARMDTVYQIEAALQHDFSLSSPRIEPLGERVVNDLATIATGDVFVQDDRQREAIAALGADLVDMESYAYASVCAKLGVPLQLFKVPSDFADSNTTHAEWDGVVGSKSSQLLQFADKYLPELLR